MPRPTVAVLVGSARRGSFNRRLANAITRAGKDRFDFKFSRIDDLPLYNQDDEDDPPEPVRRLKREIDAADALLFVMPEHNRSIPALLKNAIDWGSRPYGKSVWGGKPGAIAGASPGAIGTAVGQQHLRAVLSVLDVPVFGQPEMYIAFKDTLLDEDDRPADDDFAKLVGRFLDRYETWIDRFARVPA